MRRRCPAGLRRRPPPPSSRGARGALAALLLAVTGCAAAAPLPATDGLADLRRQPLAWGPCAPGGHPDAQCATLLVPRDYQDPNGARWSLGLARLPAKGASAGAVFVNPGGPGLSSVADLLGSEDTYDRLRTRYDIVTFDPRGVGASAPAVRCFSDALIKAIRDQPSQPSTAVERDKALALATDAARACAAAAGADLPLFGTREVARDIDLFRSILGQDKLHYFGFSYGTYLGATYADMFPGRTARVVLDSAMDPANDYVRLRHDQAVALDAAIRRFTEDCTKRADCPLSGGAEAAMAQLKSIVTALDAKPFAGADGRVLSGQRMQNFIDSSMYSPETGWPTLRKALAAAVAGDLAKVLEDAHGPGQLVNPADAPYLAVMCHDLRASVGAEGIAQLADTWATDAPFTGRNRAWSVAPCAAWPVRTATPPAPLRAAGSGEILVVGVTGDPATPVGWARSLAASLAHGHLLEWQGDGHIAYHRGGACTDDAIDAFFLTGKLPAAGDVCPPSPR